MMTDVNSREFYEQVIQKLDELEIDMENHKNSLDFINSGNINTYGLLPKFLPSIFCEAWVPANPTHFIPYYVKSITQTQLENPVDKFSEPIYKIRFVSQYLAESASFEQYRYRATNVFYDWAVFNAILGSDPTQVVPIPFVQNVPWIGVEVANEYLLKCIQKYQQERLNSFPLNSIELRNMKRFKDIGQARGAYRDRVIGAGVFGQNIPEDEKIIGEPFRDLWRLPPIEESRPKIREFYKIDENIGGDSFYDLNLEPLPTIFERVQPGYKFEKSDGEKPKFLKFAEKVLTTLDKTLKKNKDSDEQKKHSKVDPKPEQVNEEPRRDYNILPSGKVSQYAESNQDKLQDKLEIQTIESDETTADLAALDEATDQIADATIYINMDVKSYIALDAAVDRFLDKFITAMESYPEN